MILLVDTSNPVCRLVVVNKGDSAVREWEAGRTLARHILSWVEELLASQGASLRDLSGIGVFRGPGSFTGLRIGMTVMNTIADSQATPIVGVEGDNWRDEAIVRLRANENDKIVLPLYGGEARITQPRK